MATNVADIFAAPRMPCSTKRYRPIRDTRTGAEPLYRRTTRRPEDEELLEELAATGTTGRAPHVYSQQRRGSLHPVPNTYDDEQVAPSMRGGRSAPHYQQPQYPVKQRSLWPFFVGVLITLFLVLLYYVVGTIGATFWVTHITDPTSYGPAHGQVTSGVFGGGDSDTQPSKVIGTNSDGHVAVIKFTASDPGKAMVIPGPDLAKIGFPDPVGANVEVHAGDFDHDSNQDIKVTIVATVFYTPFERYSREYVLYGDGQGNLKQRDPL
jgi:hypothetical protein